MKHDETICMKQVPQKIFTASEYKCMKHPLWSLDISPTIMVIGLFSKVKSRAKARGAAEIMGNMGKAWENHGKIMENYRRNGKHGKIMEMFISEHHESLIVTVWF